MLLRLNLEILPEGSQKKGFKRIREDEFKWPNEGPLNYLNSLFAHLN